MKLLLLVFIALLYGCKGKIDTSGQTQNVQEEDTTLLEAKTDTFAQTCNLQIEYIFDVKNQKGILTYTDSIPGVRFGVKYYFIEYSNIEDRHPPYRICNPIQNQLFSLKPDDSIKVWFSGRVENLPETADSFSLRLELDSIRPYK